MKYPKMKANVDRIKIGKDLIGPKLIEVVKDYSLSNFILITNPNKVGPFDPTGRL